MQTLVTISEVYEVLERYEDSKVLLLRAYRRSPVGRTVLYRLVECCIKLRQFDHYLQCMEADDIQSKISRIHPPPQLLLREGKDLVQQLVWGEMGSFVRMLLWEENS